MVTQWVRPSERLPTEEEMEHECVLVAYLLDGQWDITDTNFRPSWWQPPHMRRPDYWTFARFVAPSDEPETRS